MERRGFLKAAVTGIAGVRSIAAGLVGGATASFSISSVAGLVTIDLSVFALSKSVSATKNVLTWQYIDLSQSAPGALGAGIVVFQGDAVVIQLQNTLSSHSIKLKIPGFDNRDWVTIPPGGVGSYQFTPVQAGSYVIYDEANGSLGRAMGLAMPLVVLPISTSTGVGTDVYERLYNRAPIEHSYQREYTLMLNELDSRINDAVQAGNPVDMDTYEPDYFFVNGLSYPDTVYDINGNVDDGKAILMSTDEQVAIRFINGGLIYYPMHFHGYHVNVILRDRVLESAVVEKDTVLVRPGESVDNILHVGGQTGLYPLHTHYVPGVTSAGSYAGGGLLMLKAI